MSSAIKHQATSRLVHDMVSHRLAALEASVLSQRLFLPQSCGVCRWAGGLAWNALSSRCENIAPMAFERPRASVPLPSPPLVVDCALLGRSSSRAILASSTRAGCYPCGILVLCIVGAICGGFLPQIRAETDGVCSHAGRKR